jgi:hypothetical protein
MKLGTLNVVVAYNMFKTDGPNGVRKTTTTITVRMGEMVFANRTVGGRYSQTDALREFKRFPAKFTPAADMTAETVKAIAA